MADLLAALPIPLAEQIAELEREIALRRRVYPRWVANGKMRQEVADQNIRRMEAAAKTLRSLPP